MPRNTRTISIFLASPSDVSPERETVDQAIAEWNQIRSRDHGVYFELLRWETTVSSGFGDDAQQVVTSQVGDDYDALIAVFWARIGTETPRAESGSVEEYERALSRRQAGEEIEISFFFKDAALPLKEIDFDQAKAVNLLKERVQGEGALSKEFIDQNGLRYEINLLLDRLARRFGEGSRSTELETTTPTPDREGEAVSSKSSERNEDIGFLDILESIETHSDLASAFLNEMTQRLDAMSAETTDIAAEIEERGKLGTVQPQFLKPLISRMTKGMEEFSDFLEGRGDEYAQHSLGMAEDARSLIDLAQDFDTPEATLSELEGTLASLLESMKENLESMKGLLGSTEGLQRMTVAFNHARKRMTSNLRVYISDSQSAFDVLQKAFDEIRTLRRSEPF